MRTIIAVIAVSIFILLVMGISKVVAQGGLPTYGTIFSEQCDSATSALFLHNGRMYNIDLAALFNLHVEPGIWEGYDSPTPFGGTFRPNDRANPGGERAGSIYLYTPCDRTAKFSYAWRNTDGTITIFVLNSDRTTNIRGEECNPHKSPARERCGNHDFNFGYIDAAEWDGVVNSEAW